MNILITGAYSYVGEKVAKYLLSNHPDYRVDQLDMQSDAWRQHDFSGYDAVFHVAGLAHRKITSELEPLYYQVNRDLAIETAKKAKDSGVRLFIFMSSMSVYSDDTTYVDDTTPTNPDNAYGKSKLQAEEGILPLAGDGFVVSVIRPPMIYGKGCKGNYNALRKLALKLPAFPLVDNRRSMLFIDNLSAFVDQLIKTGKPGIFFPQNAELVNTSQWARCIAEANHKNLRLSGVLGWCARAGKHIPGISGYCVKAFGDSYYDPAMSEYPDMPYQTVTFRESIVKTEESE